MAEKQPRCNICGVPESEWGPEMKCTNCGRHACDMRSVDIVEQRVFDWCEKHGLLTYGSLDRAEARIKLSKSKLLHKTPKYVRNAIAGEGTTYEHFSNMPEKVYLRVCHDSKDGSLTVGEVVWKDKFGLNFLQEAACLDAENCNGVFDGAMFEEVCEISGAPGDEDL